MSSAHPEPSIPSFPTWQALSALGDARRLLILLAVGGGLGKVPQLPATWIDAVAPEVFLRSLLPATAGMLRIAAQAMADALDADVAQLLHFTCLPAGGTEFGGTHGRLRRFDRIWGGPTLVELEAEHELRYLSPLQSHARWLLTRGAVRLGPTRLQPYTSFQLDSGAEMLLAKGAAVLIRQPPLHALIEAAQAAGFATSELIAGALGRPRPGIPTPAGGLDFDAASRTAVIENREVRLTLSETRALALLCQTPGVVVARHRFADVLGMVQPRTVDRVIVQLRNKLGDGLITTIYGSGYLLEVARG